MSQWNPSPILGSANWGGNPQVATKNQLLSTSAGGVTISLLTSTSFGLANYTTTTSNALQTEINNIVAGGTTSQWANYRAINNVDLSGHYLFNATYLSTMDLQVSSINGADISIFNSTVNVGGITIVGGTVNTSNITVQPAKGGGGGGGNNPTQGGSGNNTFTMINNTVGAVMDTVSKTQQAISGVLNNTGAVLFQTYYAVETAGAVIDLANGAVQLATNAQAMYDTREQNLISGPAGVPGQTSYVYETINGTTQFQFSTLGSPVYSVFRTTDQINPNKTFGKEIFTSTIIPAGSKVLRSVSDPYQFPLMSTIAISTTNYLQSFGQWHAILEPEYNLFASTLTANSISTLNISTGSASISSINGLPISAFLNTGDATFTSISTNQISSAQITVSSLNVRGGLIFSTLSGYDITRTLTSSATTYDSVSSVTQNFLNYQMTLTSSPESFDMGSYFAISPTNEAFWSHKQLDFSQTLAGIGLLDITYGSYTNGDYFDVKNLGSVNLLIYYSIESNTLLFTLTPGSFYRFTYSSGTNNWTYSANPTQTAQTTNNTFQITQGWNTTTLSTNNLLIVKAAEVIIPGALTVQAGFINNITGQNAYLSSIVSNTATFSTLVVSTSYTQNIIDTTISTSTGVFDKITVSSFYNGFGSISSAKISSLTTNGIIFSSLPNGSYDIVKSFASTTAQNYNAISSLTQNILNYNVSATAASEGIIDFEVSFVCNSANVADWEQQVLTTSYIGNAQIGLFNLNRTAYFDVYRSVGYPITVYDWTSGSQRALFIIYPTNTITYRVTGTVAGAITTWTYTTSPGTGGTFTTANNLTVSQDLQNVYVSTLNRLQFNAGDIYMNGNFIAPTGFIDNLYGTNSYFSTISTLNLNIGNITVQNEIIGDLVVTNNISCANQVAVLQADGNAALVRAFEIYTKYPGVTGNPSPYSQSGPYDNLSNVKMLTSEMFYNVWDGYVNTGLGYVSNITFDSNYDLYVNNTYLGRPTNKGSLGFIAVAYNGSLGTYPGCLLRAQTTLPASLGTALNAYTLTLSNSSGAGGSDYVTLYGAGWDPSQIGNIYMPSYSTGSPGIIYNQAGSNKLNILANSPGTPFPNTTKSAVDDTISGLTHVAGGPNNGILVVGAPNLWFGGTCNIDMRWGNNGYLSFNQRKSYNFTLNGSYSDGPHGYINTNNGKNSADYNGAISFNGQTFNYADYTCTVSMAGFHLQKVGDAIDQVNVWCQNNGGLWWLYCYLEVQAYAGEPQNNPVSWDVTVTLVPKGVFAGSGVYDLSGSPVLSSINTGLTYIPSAYVSSMIASTVTIKATENASLLAGNFTVPTYFSTGSITVGGTNQVSLLANIVAIGGQKDVDIAGYTGNVNIAAGSNINLVADNYLYISSGSYMNTDVYGDITTDLGGVYTVTSAEVINLNGSNGIGLNSSNAINLTAASNVNIDTFTTIQLPGTASIQSVSPLALTSGNQYDGAQNKSQIEFQYYGGGFNHYISSRHNANVTYDSGNAIDFWLYSVYTGGDAQTASSAPGTGNVCSMSITAAGVFTFRPLYLISDFNRRLSGTDIVQPIIQYGTETGGGTSSSVTISLPVAYTSATSYVAMVSMEDSTPAKMSVTRDSASQITIYWALGGSGSHTLTWTTSGT